MTDGEHQGVSGGTLSNKARAGALGRDQPEIQVPAESLNELCVVLESTDDEDPALFYLFFLIPFSFLFSILYIFVICS